MHRSFDFQWCLSVDVYFKAFSRFSHHSFILDSCDSFIMTKGEKKGKKKKSQSSIPGTRRSSNPSNLWRSERDRKQTVIPEPPGAELNCNYQMERTEKKKKNERNAKNRKKKNPKKKKKTSLKKKLATSSPSNPESLAFRNNKKQKKKVKNEELMNDINKLRNVPRSPHNKHSKAPLMRIIDIFNQENWQETIRQLNDNSSPTKQLNRVDPEVRRVNLEWMMKDHHPTKILHKRFNKLYCEIMGKLCRSKSGLRILQGVNNLLTSADLTTRQRWKILNGLKDAPYEKIRYLSFGEEELPSVEFGDMRQDNLMAKVDYRIRYINTKKGMQLLENQGNPLVPKEEIGDYIGAVDLGDLDMMDISSKFYFLIF